jgi:hypothetical protein
MATKRKRPAYLWPDRPERETCGPLDVVPASSVRCGRVPVIREYEPRCPYCRARVSRCECPAAAFDAIDVDEEADETPWWRLPREGEG